MYERFVNEIFDDVDLLESTNKASSVTPRPDQYIRWVQLSLRRLLGIKLKASGEDSPAYRGAVKQFQWGQGLSPSGKVGIQTQNALIKANAADPSYVRWVQRALNKVGAGSLVLNGSFDKATRDAVLSFQSYNGGLEDDGWVGVKTELILIQRSALLPPDRPGGYPPLRPPVTPVEEDKPRTRAERFDTYLPKIVDRFQSLPRSQQPHRAICMLKKLMAPKVDDRYLSRACFILYRRPGTDSRSLTPFLVRAGIEVDAVLKHRRTLEEMSEGVLEIDYRIHCGVLAINLWEYRDNQMEFSVLTNPATRKAFVFTAKMAEDNRTVLSCYSGSFGGAVECDLQGGCTL